MRSDGEYTFVGYPKLTEDPLSVVFETVSTTSELDNMIVPLRSVPNGGRIASKLGIIGGSHTGPISTRGQLLTHRTVTSTASDGSRVCSWASKGDTPPVSAPLTHESSKLGPALIPGAIRAEAGVGLLNTGIGGGGGRAIVFGTTVLVLASGVVQLLIRSLVPASF